MKSLRNQEDVSTTHKAMEQAPSWFLNIPDTKTPWYFINLDYADGFVHWYESGAGRRRVVCAGGLVGKGFDTDNCPICQHVLELYQEAKQLTAEGDTAKAKQLKDRANNMRGKPEVHFKVIRGQRVLIKTKTGKDYVADFDMEDDDSNAGIGIISMSQSQFDSLTGLIGGTNSPFVKDGDDLGNRVLWTSKESRKGKTGAKYSAVVWIADELESPMPDVEIPQELLDKDLGEDFVVDTEEVEKVYTLLSGQTLEDPEDDEEVELDDDSDDTVDDADLDDLDDDEDPEDDDDEDDEAFVDDIPGEDDEEEPAPKKATVKKNPPTKAVEPQKKSALTPKTYGKGVARKSGKTRL